MNIEQHVPKLETCKKLQEAGWKPSSTFITWVVPTDASQDALGIKPHLSMMTWKGTEKGDVMDMLTRQHPAPLLSELLEVLLFKEQMMDIHIQVSKTEEYTATVFFSKNYQGMGDNPAEAAAQLVLTLVEEGILTL